MEAPKWKKVKGEEHTLTNGSVEYDLLGLEEYACEMANQGWRLIRVTMGSQLTFVACEPGQFVYRTALTVKKNGFFDKDAAASMEKTLGADGATVVEQRTSLGAKIGIIFERPAALGPFELTKDLDSRILEYGARKQYSQGAGITFLIIALLYIPLSIVIDNLAFIAIGVCFIAIAGNYLRPVKKYTELIAELKAQREGAEA